MALDPQIPLETHAPQVQSPVSAIGQLLSLKNLGLQTQSAEQEQQLRGAEIVGLQRQTQAAIDLGTAYSGAMVKDPETGISSLDPNKLEAAIGANPLLAPQLPAIKEALANSSKAAFQMAQQRRSALAWSAYGAKAAGGTPGAFHAALANAMHMGVLTPSDAAPYLSAAQQNPDQISGLLDKVIALDPDVVKQTTSAESAKIGLQGAKLDLANKQVDAALKQLQASMLGLKVPGLPAGAPSAAGAGTVTAGLTLPDGSSPGMTGYAAPDGLLNVVDSITGTNPKLLGDLTKPYRTRLQYAFAFGGAPAIAPVLKDLTAEAEKRGADVNPTLISTAVSKAARTAAATQEAVEKVPIPLPSWVTDPTPPTGKDAQVVDPVTGLTHAAAYQSALNAIQNHEELPALGLSASPRQIAQRTAIINMMGAILAHSGKDLPQVSGALKADQATLDRLTPIYAASVGSETAANGMGQLMLQAAAKTPATQMPAANRYVRWSQDKLEGQPNVSAFELSVYAFSREYARVVGGGAASVSQLTDTASAEAQKFINAAQNPQQLAAVVSQAKQDMNAYTSGYEHTINQTLGHMQQIYQQPGAATTTRNPNTPPPATDLQGLQAGHGRTFTSGPHKGQTWTIGPDGQPVQVLTGGGQ